MNIYKYTKGKNKVFYRVKGYLGIDPITNKKKFISRAGFKTKTDAKNHFAEEKYKFQKKVDMIKGDITYQYLYDMYIDYYKNTVKESTFQKTKTIFEINILPIFGDYKVKNITPIMCQNFYKDITTKYVSGGSYFNYAKSVLDYGNTLNIVNVNPFENVLKSRKKERSKVANFLEIKEVQDLLNSIDDIMWYNYFRLLIFTGLRKSEALALNWSDIDLNFGYIKVSKTLAIGEDYKLMISTPKSLSSVRTITLDKKTIDELKKYKDISGSDAIVFPSTKNTYINPSRASSVLDKYVSKANINKNIRVHDLRHTHASLLYASGMDIKSIQERLGHANIDITLDTYTHLTRDMKLSSIENFSKFIDF